MLFFHELLVSGINRNDDWELLHQDYPYDIVKNGLLIQKRIGHSILSNPYLMKSFAIQTNYLKLILIKII